MVDGTIALNGQNDLRCGQDSCHRWAVAGGIADIGGLMVIVALIGMLVGVLRYSGSLDTASGAAR